MSHHIPVVPRGAEGKTGRAIAGGVFLLASGFGLFYANMHRVQRKKEMYDEMNPGAWPTWQFRLRQAANIPNQPVHEGTMTLKASRIEPRLATLPARASEHHNGHSVIPKERVPLPAFDAEGNPNQLNPRKSIAQPAPQRDRGDGRPYTKSPDFYDRGLRREKENQTRDRNILITLVKSNDAYRDISMWGAFRMASLHGGAMSARMDGGRVCHVWNYASRTDEALRMDGGRACHVWNYASRTDEALRMDGDRGAACSEQPQELAIVMHVHGSLLACVHELSTHGLESKGHKRAFELRQEAIPSLSSKPKKLCTGPEANTAIDKSLKGPSQIRRSVPGAQH
ncbi:hypothetical protein NEOLEDRAFT_1149232 [Neolentinus lepideus HHB14362 ss-1]|uniref:Uncharacterized protein n=1 Tax=Neolentinus lepideus HHB14362 ss-1 TaxID=1314782 RepID=A0A165RFD2_9AGAM|nr:hypothetical protein NEOLEDRAFT_1149232 [Neolentinus lepideus HHB14362 ss-1]